MNESSVHPASSTHDITIPRRQMADELQHLRKIWWGPFLLGIGLILGGIVAVTFPIFSTFGVIMVLGIVLLFAGVATIVTSFMTGKWSAFLVQLLMGILYTVIGVLMAESPLASAAALTLLVASFSIAGGVFRVVAALQLRFSHWGWVLTSGMIAILFGIVVLRHFPEAAPWLIGLMLGLDLIFGGLNWLLLSLTIRSLPPEHDKI